MKKFLLTLLTFALMSHETSAETCTNESYQYISVGTGPVVLIPNVGMGYRTHNGCYGFDMSLNYSTVFVAHELQASFVGHYYLNCFNFDATYVGVGAASGFLFENRGKSILSFAPDFVFGKEFTKCDGTKHFLEAHVQAPTWFTNDSHVYHHARLDLPLMYIKYGFAF